MRTYKQILIIIIIKYLIYIFVLLEYDFRKWEISDRYLFVVTGLVTLVIIKLIDKANKDFI